LGKSREKPYTAFANTQRFSKTYKTNLVHLPSTFTDKYVKLNGLFTNESTLSSSTSYGMTRQHGLTSIAAVLNNNAMFLDQRSFTKFLTYTMQYNSGTNFIKHSARLLRPYYTNPRTTIRSLNTMFLSNMTGAAFTAKSSNYFAHVLSVWSHNALRASDIMNFEYCAGGRVVYPLHHMIKIPKVRAAFRHNVVGRVHISGAQWADRLLSNVVPLPTLSGGVSSMTAPWFTLNTVTSLRLPKTYQNWLQCGVDTPFLVNASTAHLEVRSTEKYRHYRENMTVVTPHDGLDELFQGDWDDLTPEQEEEERRRILLSFANRYYTGRSSFGFSPLDSNAVRLHQSSATTTPLYYYHWKQAVWSDLVNFNRLASARLRFGGRVMGGHRMPPLFSSDPTLTKVNYDASGDVKQDSVLLQRVFGETYQNLPSLDRDLLFYLQAEKIRRVAAWSGVPHSYMYDFFAVPYTRVSGLVDGSTLKPYYFNDEKVFSDVRMLSLVANLSTKLPVLYAKGLDREVECGADWYYQNPLKAAFKTVVDHPSSLHPNLNQRPALILVTDKRQEIQETDKRGETPGMPDFSVDVNRHSRLGTLSGFDEDYFEDEQPSFGVASSRIVDECLNRSKSFVWHRWYKKTETFKSWVRFTRSFPNPQTRLELGEKSRSVYPMRGRLLGDVSTWPAWKRDLGYTTPYTSVKSAALAHSRLLPRVSLKTFVPMRVKKSVNRAYEQYKAWSIFFGNSSVVKVNMAQPFTTSRTATAVISRYFDEYVKPRWVEAAKHVQGRDESSGLGRGGRLVNFQSFTGPFIFDRSVIATSFGVLDHSLNVLSGLNSDEMTQALGWESNTLRLSRAFTIRRGWKGFKTYLKAYAKVMHPRIDKGNSFATSGAFANVYPPRPFLNDRATNMFKVARLFGKNRESFFTTHSYVNRPLPIFNELSSNFNLTNYYFYEFPFLLGRKSDASKYSWFDWYSRWYSYQVTRSERLSQNFQGLTVWPRRFAFDKGRHLQIAARNGVLIRKRLFRRNPISLWLGSMLSHHYRVDWLNCEPYYVPTPKLILKPSFVAYNDRVVIDETVKPADQVRREHYLWEIKRRVFVPKLPPLWRYWRSRATIAFLERDFTPNLRHLFTPTFSGSYRCTWRPYTSVQAYNYNTLVLADLLTKRELLYRKYLEARGKVGVLPPRFTVSPANPLFKVIRSSFLLASPMSFMGEVSREFYLDSSEYFTFLMFKALVMDRMEAVRGYWTSSEEENMEVALPRTATVVSKEDEDGFRATRDAFLLHSPIRLPLVTEYLFFYFCRGRSAELGQVSDLYKSQYRPLRKGLMNMVRLQMSGTMALPTGTRLQVMASSKDVIHSWAIPSAGVKIDCIPGYTSHRIMIFFNPGVYWGQCMEICGRYHHWMPIVVYFLHRDLFILWVGHFLHHRDAAAPSLRPRLGTRAFGSWVKAASYDHHSWLVEVLRRQF